MKNTLPVRAHAAGGRPGVLQKKQVSASPPQGPLASAGQPTNLLGQRPLEGCPPRMLTLAHLAASLPGAECQTLRARMGMSYPKQRRKAERTLFPADVL